jgi:hypothetical protein
VDAAESGWQAYRALAGTGNTLRSTTAVGAWVLMQTNHGRGAQRTAGLLVASLALAVTPLSQVPAAAGEPAQIAPDSATALRGVAVDIPVLGNDTFGDPPPTAQPIVSIRTNPTSGVATVEDVDGTGPLPAVIRYTPALTAPLGTDLIEYVVSADGVELGSAVITVDVRNAPPVAGEDAGSVTSLAGALVSLPVLTNDSDPELRPLTVVGLTQPGHGSASTDASTVTYDPVDDYVGPDEFSYTVSDGEGGQATARVVMAVTDGTTAMVLGPDLVTAVSGTPLPIEVLANDASGGRDPLTIVSAGPAASGAAITVSQDRRSVSYTSPPAFSGADAFTYVVRDRRGNEATGTVSVTVQAAPAPRTVSISVSGPLTRRDVPYSYRPGCPVRPSSLRRMRINYWDYTGQVRRGTLIVRSDAVKDLTHVFTRAFVKKFRIKKMIPSDSYYDKGRRSPTASDQAAMAAGNTSAFNCRPVVGNPTKRSMHSYGVAIDINTFENPYVVRSGFYPRAAGAYLRRTPCRMGMICPRGPIPTAMRERGWFWGARWSRPDYQHFSANGG